MPARVEDMGSTHTGVFPACDRVTRIDMAAVSVGVVVAARRFRDVGGGEKAAATRDARSDGVEDCTKSVLTSNHIRSTCDSCRPPMAQNVKVGVLCLLTSRTQNLVANRPANRGSGVCEIRHDLRLLFPVPLHSIGSLQARKKVY